MSGNILVLIVISFGVAVVWAASAAREFGAEPTFGHLVCHVSISQGATTVTLFRTDPEDEFYRSFRVPFWSIESAIGVLAIVLGWRERQAGRIRSSPGFSLD
jgi:hypothetical protein